MPDTATEKIIIPRTMPLRLFGRGPYELTCAYDWIPDDTVTLQHLQGNRQHVHIEARALEEKGLVRQWIYSKIDSRHIFTMTGYLGDFDVKVSAWKDADKYRNSIDRWEAEPIALIKLIEMKHVEGLERAIAQHKTNTQTLELSDISLEDAQKVYGAMVGHCPSLK